MHLLHQKAKFGWFLALLVGLAAAVCAEEQVTVKGARMWPAPESTRLVFDLSGPVNHSLFTLANPDRVVIDIDNAVLPKPILNLDFSQGLINGLRSAPQGKGVRFVLDLRGRVRPKSFALRPNKEYGDRLVIDLDDLDKLAANTPPTPPPGPPKPPEAAATRDIIVAVDAGHGGEDPGAIGPNGTREKDVVLAIARRLAAMIDDEPGMRAVMIRSGDYYVSLNNRVGKAQEQRADLFISVHADAFRDRRARGSSVYILSQRGASSEYARLLADKENASDQIGGVNIDDKDPLVRSVLIDLSQTAAIEAGNDAAGRVLRSLRDAGHIHRNRVEQAGFRVLKAAAIPSMLVETAFISNPVEERNLRTSSYQNDLAKAMMAGIRAYFEHNPPPGTKLAKSSREHVVAKGDTLAGVARSYRVSLESLRATNNLDDDASLRPGDVLRIPPS